MNYLLDTHYILWTLFNPQLIKEKVVAILEDEKSTKYVSGISLWEISLKYSIGKLELEDSNPEEVCDEIKKSGFELLEVDNHLFSSYYKLPKKEHHNSNSQFEKFINIFKLKLLTFCLR
jgi:PIN domain nuclease of toxin-antitoxin system